MENTVSSLTMDMTRKIIGLAATKAKEPGRPAIDLCARIKMPMAELSMKRTELMSMTSEELAAARAASIAVEN